MIFIDRADGFYTFKGYQMKSHERSELTAAMEDYLEMICRVTADGKSVRVGDISRLLHVRPSSVSKMIQQLGEYGYITARKYGVIQLTEKGRSYGGYLLYRHEVVNRFLCALNHSGDELEQAEKIEHFLNPETVENLAALTLRIELM